MGVYFVAKWSKEDKLRALAIAEASSIREAGQRTGIPQGSIKRWRMEQRGVEPNDPNRTEPSKKIEGLALEAVEQAKQDVREYVADRVKQVSDGLLELVELAKVEAVNLIQSGQDPSDSKAQWLRSVVGAIAQGVEKHQLLEGKPTSRQEVQGEVKTKHEEQYSITHTIETYTDSFRNVLSRRNSLLGSNVASNDSGQPLYSAETDDETS